MKKHKLLAPYASQGFLRGWSADDLGRLERTSTMLDFGAGEVVSRDVTSGREFLVLLEGSATLRGVGDPAQLHAGDHIGESAILGGPHVRSTVVADTDGTALLMSEQEFVSLLSTAPSFGSRLTQSLVLRAS